MFKKEIREEIRNRKRQFTSSQLDEMSLAVLCRLLSHPRIKSAQTVLMYYSLPDEVNTHQAVDELVKEGKQVLLPVVKGENELELRIYHDRSDLCEGSFHIMEPTGTIFNDYSKIDAAVVPGMGFDKDCNRLGRGKGYYDRLLAKIPDVYKIGICFDFQKVESLPTGKYDIKMDEVL
jgi:5-formyltetrahydrofolate cyclo-ligase